MPGNLLTSMFVLWVGESVTHLNSTTVLLLALASVLVTLVAGALFVSKYFFIPLSILALLLIVWTLFVPVAIPTPPFRSEFVTALERSNATLRTLQHDNTTADAEVLASFLPNGLTIREAEILLRKERFDCGPFQDDGAREAARWGEKYRHYMVCNRTTYYHPLYVVGWRIELFANQDDVIESVRARRSYEGL